MKEILSNLLKVKSLMTIIIAAGLLFGFITGVITSEQFMQIAVMVFTFYFAKNSLDGEA